MQTVLVKEIIEFTGGRLTLGKPDAEVKSFSLDSRTLKKGDLFIAIKGNNFDGHKFAEDCIKKGACGIIVEDSFQINNNFSGIAIKVKDTTKALGDIARIYRKKFQGSLIAITGTVGKTTTKELVALVMQERFSVHKTEGTLNNHIGVPVTLLGLSPGHHSAVIELGMSGLGEIKYLAGIAQPDVGVITNIGPAHLEQLGSIDNVLKAKSELLEVMKKDGLVILNRDDKYFGELHSRKHSRLITIGRHHEADFQAVDIAIGKDGGISFKLLAKPFSDILEIKLPVIGMHNIYPAMTAAAIGYGLNVGPAGIINGLGKVRLPKLRLELKEVAGMKIIDDCYNANPISMVSALETLNMLHAEGKKIFVCSDMKELGQYAEMYHKELGKQVHDYKIDRLISVGEFSAFVSETAVECGMPAENVRHCKNNLEAVEVLSHWLEPGGIVLVKGSRANHMEEITSGIEEYYSTLEKLIV